MSALSKSGQTYSNWEVKHTDKTYHLYNEKKEKKSFWHDLDYRGSGYGSEEYNMVVEIPQNRLAKMEYDKEKDCILQNVKKCSVSGKTVDRYYPIFPEFNYGFIPQTHEPPVADPQLDGLRGDNDPLDVLELSGAVCSIGSILKVKVIGCLPLIDQGEVDYKMLAVRTDHPLSANVSSIAEYNQLHPHRLAYIINWFIRYKILEGKKANSYAKDGLKISAAEALALVEKHHLLYLQTNAK